MEYSHRNRVCVLVKLFLSTAVSVACVQDLWLILRRKSIKVSTIDSLYDILGSGWSFLDLDTWLRGPSVVFLALIAWYALFYRVLPKT